MEKIDVLVVDDERVFCIILEKRLKALGYNSRSALSASDALDLLGSIRPMMIITDLMMPDIDGIEFIKILRKKRNFKDLYILMLSARSDEEAWMNSKAAGANEFVTKPIDDDELSIKIEIGIRWSRERGKKTRRNTRI
jgi:DNA-binding response OmpR family regulator